MISLVIALLTLAGLGVIFLAAFLRLWITPPVIELTIHVPDEFKLVMQKLPATIETDKIDEVPIPGKILLYISQESDDWAQEGRTKRARALYTKCQNWDVVLQLMRQEDGELETA